MMESEALRGLVKLSCTTRLGMLLESMASKNSSSESTSVSESSSTATERLCDVVDSAVMVSEVALRVGDLTPVVGTGNVTGKGKEGTGAAADGAAVVVDVEA
jgi:hypothetical protein